MRNALILLGIVSVALLAGCGSGEDPALNQAAPPPSGDAVPEQGMSEKNRPGANGVTPTGGAESPALATPMEKPADAPSGSN
jgi:hypothetical protein